MNLLYCDIETYSETPIRNGTYAYAEDCEVMLFAYALNDGPVEVIDLTAGEEMLDLESLLNDDPDLMTVWHNGMMFDRTCLRYGLGITVPPERVIDTMQMAFAHSLPGALGTLCYVMGLPEDKHKDDRGKELIQMFCKPRPARQHTRRYTAETHPDQWGEFRSYAGQDIVAMRELYKRLPKWNYRDGERELAMYDALINDRGFAVDLDLAHKATEAIKLTQRRLSDDTIDKTLGFVLHSTERDALLKHITYVYNVDLPDMQKSTLERRINDPNLPKEVRDLLTMRLEASKASTAKYKSLIRASNSDGRLRGTIQFCGASRTGRDSGRTFQPQNLPRSKLSAKGIETGIAAIKAGTMCDKYRNVMEICSGAVRGCIIAPPGKRLVVADLSNIEGRVLAWLAGEKWKVEAFRKYDEGTGPDLYCAAYGKAFRKSASKVTKDERQIGKVLELACGYGGGVGAFLSMATAYSMDVNVLANAVRPSLPGSVLRESTQLWEWFQDTGRSTFDLSKNTFIALDGLKRLWRQAHPEIVAFWSDAEHAFEQVARVEGKSYKCRKLVVRRDGSWLRIILPSGRALCYPSPKLDGRRERSYRGVDAYTRKWQEIKTYGGKLVENCTQAVARDVFKGTDMRPGSIQRTTIHEIEQVGFNILLPVHDELICEAPDSDEFSVEHLCSLMTSPPTWAMDLPLSADGFVTKRYRKE